MSLHPIPERFYCPHCLGEIMDSLIFRHASRHAIRMSDPARFRLSPGRPRTVAHQPDNPKCPCADCRKARKAAK